MAGLMEKKTFIYVFVKTKVLGQRLNANAIYDIYENVKDSHSMLEELYEQILKLFYYDNMSLPDPRFQLIRQLTGSNQGKVNPRPRAEQLENCSECKSENNIKIHDNKCNSRLSKPSLQCLNNIIKPRWVCVKCNKIGITDQEWGKHFKLEKHKKCSDVPDENLPSVRRGQQEDELIPEPPWFVYQQADQDPATASGSESNNLDSDVQLATKEDSWNESKRVGSVRKQFDRFSQCMMSGKDVNMNESLGFVCFPDAAKTVVVSAASKPMPIPSLFACEIKLPKKGTKLQQVTPTDVKVTLSDGCGESIEAMFAELVISEEGEEECEGYSLIYKGSGLLLNPEIGHISLLDTTNNRDGHLMREELQLSQESASYVGEVVKAMDKKKVLVDPLVSLMMVEKVPDSTYENVGGLDKQIKEIKEVIELPVKHPELFDDALGIAQPKGVLLYGPPGTGKTLLAHAVAHHTDCMFIRVSCSELVQKFIGEGSRMVRELFVMAREHAPSIIFMDEIDSIGSMRLEGGSESDSELQSTMLELLNQLDSFEPKQNIKVIMATNRIDILDSALLRPGRIDRKIEFPAPNKEARLDILNIHSRKMNLARGINLQKIAEIMTGASGTEVKGVCTEASMYALRERRDHVTQEDFELAVAKVMQKDNEKNMSIKKLGK